MDDMILSASGWRGIFAADDDEESKTEQISTARRMFSAAAAFVFAQYLGRNPLVLLGTDTRPTGKAIIEAIVPVLLSAGCDVQYAGIVAAPEIMAWARSKNFTTNQHELTRTGNKSENTGFIYVSASHNPIGHNGLKFGLTDGGVLAVDEADKLISSFRSFMGKEDSSAVIDKLTSNCDSRKLSAVYENIDSFKYEARKAYYDFCGEVVYGGNSNKGTSSIAGALRSSLIKNPIGIVCDFNGSARTASIDKDFLSALGFKFECINDSPGQIVHNIVPEGKALEPCAGLLEEVHRRDPSFVLGYVPDCDGDRGNLVIWDDTINKARALEAQEVFALACVAELAHLVWSGDLIYGSNGKALVKAAIAINDPTSMRIDRIAHSFGISVFRAEVGEANVVTLARKLREDGYIVRILGEGSAGGNITHPSAVRDPINTVLAIAKLLTIRSACCKAGLYKIWCKRSGQIKKYKSNFMLSDIITSLPPFFTTAAYNSDAIMRIKSDDHIILKDRYQDIFLRQWEEKKDELKRRFNLYGWEAIAYNGTAEKRGLTRFGEAGKGGLKVLFFDNKGKETAFIWMRGSATEPVFRIMAEGMESSVERYLLDWQRQMIMIIDNK